MLLQAAPDSCSAAQDHVQRRGSATRGAVRRGRAGRARQAATPAARQGQRGHHGPRAAASLLAVRSAGGVRVPAAVAVPQQVQAPADGVHFVLASSSLHLRAGTAAAAPTSLAQCREQRGTLGAAVQALEASCERAMLQRNARQLLAHAQARGPGSVQHDEDAACGGQAASGDPASCVQGMLQQHGTDQLTSPLAALLLRAAAGPAQAVVRVLLTAGALQGWSDWPRQSLPAAEQHATSRHTRRCCRAQVSTRSPCSCWSMSARHALLAQLLHTSAASPGRLRIQGSSRHHLLQRCSSRQLAAWRPR